MKRPAMILFDYGGTLMYEQHFDRLRCNRALFKYVRDNPQNVTAEEFTEYFSRFFDEVADLRGGILEIHEFQLMRYSLEHFGLTLSVPFEEAEIAMFDAIAEAHITPGADEMLRYLRGKGIRTGVVSNLCWSGNALNRRLCGAFPDHAFEFVMTSSEYIFRKPDSRIFDLAVRKTGLAPDEIWFCGNDIGSDIEGAEKAGLTPVFYDNKEIPHCEKDINRGKEVRPGILRLSSWEEIKEHIL